MKLAEALLERKSLKEQIGGLKERAINDARVQGGDRLAEKPDDLAIEINRLVLYHAVTCNERNGYRSENLDNSGLPSI